MAELRHIVHPFEPIIAPNCRVLILGSVPSVRSVSEGFYYMHPQNRFWPMLSRILNEDMTKLSFDKRRELLIKNNIGENKQRFNIEARIADDTGDGINDIKLFCFDWTMLSARRNHGVQFLVHDSRLISDVDPRQVAELIRVANEYCVRYDCQYILTINNSQIDAIRDELGEEFSTLIERNEVVRLDDRSEEGKLLGIQVDLKYE